MTRFDLFDPVFLDKPWDTYRELRETAPAFYVAEHDVWLLTRYDSVQQATAEPERFSSAQGNAFPRDTPERMGNTLGATDPPKHDRLRRLVMKAFTPRRVAAMEPVVRERVRAKAAVVREHQSFDFLKDFASDLTAGLVAQILGVPEADLPEVARLVDESFTVEPGRPTAGLAPVFDYLGTLVDERAKEPRDDVISGLLQAEHEGRKLELHEVRVTAGTIMAAGYASTVHALGNMLVALAEHPDQRAELRAEPSLAASAFEETLRYDAAAHIFGRTTVVDIDVHGTTIPSGARVGLCYGAANRDPRVFADPDRLLIRRTEAQHLGFGRGTHFCLGSPLARLEGRIVLEEAVNTFGDYTVEVGPSARLASPAFHGYVRIPMTLGSA